MKKDTEKEGDMATTSLSAEFTERVANSLKPLNPQKVIIFGSYANGTPHKYSDIDLYIVTNDEYTPCNFEEKSQLYSKFSKALDSLYETVPIDIIVHTKPMYEKFKEMDSSFARQILTKGVEL